MMHLNYNRTVYALVLFISLLFFAACSDDTSGGPTVEQCPAGEFYNALNGRCELRGRDGNNDPTLNNNQADAGPGDESDADNPADSGHGNDISEDGDASAPGDLDGGPTLPDTVAPDECGPGQILGKACAPSGSVLSGATVTLEGFDCDGQPFTASAQTNRDGEYSFSDVPAGHHTVTVSIGSYSGDQQVRVSAGQTTDLTTSAAKICLEAANVQIAVIEGAYDKVEGLLDDLQLQYDIKGDDVQGYPPFLPGRLNESVAFLSNLSAMQQYDIIFINCGQLWNGIQSGSAGTVTTIINNLVAYLNSGGSLYSADWAHAFVETAFPDMIDFYGEDATTSQALFGYAPQTITADVISPQLQVALGHNTTSINFPHTPPTVLNNNWAVAEGVGLQATVHLQGTVQLCASTSSCTSAGASIVDAPLLISHVTAGGGTVFFTSFHNESQGGISRDMEEILKFLIFQL